MEIQTVKCTDLIDSWTDLDLGERAALKDELLDADNFLCPNITSFQVKGGAGGGTNLNLSVSAKESTTELGLSGIFVCELSRVFSPEFY